MSTESVSGNQTTAQKSRPPLEQVTLGGGAIGFNWLPVIAAQRKGFFERHGVQVSVQRLGNVDKVTAAVKAGSVDLAITPPEGVIRDAVASGSLCIIAGNVNRLPLSLVAAPKFKRIEDLKGAVLGTSSLTEGTAIYTIEMLSKHGLKYPGDFEFSVVGVHPARWQALQEGTIDAAVQLIPLNFVAFDQGYSNLGEVPDYIPELAFSTMIADRAWAKANRDKVKAVLQGLHEGVAWVYETGHDDELTALVMELTQADEKYGKKSLDYMRKTGVFDRNLEVTAAAFATSIQLMQKAGLLDPADTNSARSALDDSYRIAALNSG